MSFLVQLSMICCRMGSKFTYCLNRQQVYTLSFTRMYSMKRLSLRSLADQKPWTNPIISQSRTGQYLILRWSLRRAQSYSCSSFVRLSYLPSQRQSIIFLKIIHIRSIAVQESSSMSIVHSTECLKFTSIEKSFTYGAYSMIGTTISKGIVSVFSGTKVFKYASDPMHCCSYLWFSSIIAIIQLHDIFSSGIALGTYEVYTLYFCNKLYAESSVCSSFDGRQPDSFGVELLFEGISAKLLTFSPFFFPFAGVFAFFLEHSLLLAALSCSVLHSLMARFTFPRSFSLSLVYSSSTLLVVSSVKRTSALNCRTAVDL